ncbi:MAG: phosphoribosylformylglycinamidine cyclo-ligase [bacterium]
MSEAYQRAGVNIRAGDEAVERIKIHARATHRPEVIGGLGGFGGLFALNVQKYRKPILVSGTDGVGTKLKLAFEMDHHETVGIDLVAMCVNDILVSGAEPLYFLDYIACEKLEPEKIENIVGGIAEGCRQAKCALLGGETAEMPGMYAQNEYDLAGFVVGVVEKDKLITGEGIRPGDLVIGFGSSGLHSNGFSLVRKLLAEKGVSLEQSFPDSESSVGEILLTPTRIYADLASSLNEKGLIKGWSHITGGGLIGNLPRILPKDMSACIQLDKWPRSELFKWLFELADLPPEEMFEVFNMGIGLIAVIGAGNSAIVERICNEMGETVFPLGLIEKGEQAIRLEGTW